MSQVATAQKSSGDEAAMVTHAVDRDAVSNYVTERTRAVQDLSEKLLVIAEEHGPGVFSDASKIALILASIREEARETFAEQRSAGSVAEPT